MMQRHLGTAYLGARAGSLESVESAFSVLHHIPSLAGRNWLDESVEKVGDARQRLACWKREAGVTVQYSEARGDIEDRRTAQVSSGWNIEDLV